jgi:hypothetical protein
LVAPVSGLVKDITTPNVRASPRVPPPIVIDSGLHDLAKLFNVTNPAENFTRAIQRARIRDVANDVAPVND